MVFIGPYGSVTVFCCVFVPCLQILKIKLRPQLTKTQRMILASTKEFKNLQANNWAIKNTWLRFGRTHETKIIMLLSKRLKTMNFQASQEGFKI